MLWAPEPRVRDGTGVYSVMSPRTRLHSVGTNLEHDALYVVSCSASGDGESETLEQTLEAITETFEFLPQAGTDMEP